MIHLEDHENDQEQSTERIQPQLQTPIVASSRTLTQSVTLPTSSDHSINIASTSIPDDTEDDEKNDTIPITPQHFEIERNWLCCISYKDKSDFKMILQHLDLTTVQKSIIETRYLHILQNLQKRARTHCIIHFIGHFIITVGSLLVPALLSIQNSDREFALTAGPFNVHIYWATFAISLLVTMWNAILTLFRIDKKYYFLNTILERLRSEGWQYVSLTGRYSGHLTKGVKPTHKNQFIYFTHYIERVKMKQIEEEYYRTDEKSQAPNTGSTNTPSNSGSVPVPSPATSIAGIPSSAIPRDIRIAHEILSRSQQQYQQIPAINTKVSSIYDPYEFQGISSPTPILYERAATLQSSPISTEVSSIRAPSDNQPISPSVDSTNIPRQNQMTSSTIKHEEPNIIYNEIKRPPIRFRDIRKKYEPQNSPVIDPSSNS